MATPITWKNIAVEAPQREAYNPMIAAQLGITAGFDKLGQVYDQYQTQRRDDNTAAFQTALSQYKTPEELQAAQASGAIDALRAQFGVQMDQKVAMNGADQRLAALMKQATDATAYTDAAAVRSVQTPEQAARQSLIDAATERDRKAAEEARRVAAEGRATVNFGNSLATHNTTQAAAELTLQTKRNDYAKAALTDGQDTLNKGLNVQMSQKYGELYQQLANGKISPTQLSDGVSSYIKSLRDSGVPEEQINKMHSTNAAILDPTTKFGVEARVASQVASEKAVSDELAAKHSSEVRDYTDKASNSDKTLAAISKFFGYDKEYQSRNPDEAKIQEVKLKQVLAAQQHMAGLVGTTRIIKGQKVKVTADDITNALMAGGADTKAWYNVFGDNGVLFKGGEFDKKLNALLGSPGRMEEATIFDKWIKGKVDSGKANITSSNKAQ